MIKEKISQLVLKAINKIAYDANIKNVHVDKPKSEFGDYATNVSFMLSKILSNDQIDTAQLLAGEIKKNMPPEISDIDVQGGYINFKLSHTFIISELNRISSEVNFGSNDSLDGKTIMIEYTDPNPFKQFHIGHLMSNTIGEGIARIYEANGAKVIRANYFGDVGVHVAKAVWAMAKNKEHMPNDSDNSQTKTKFLGDAYAQGACAYKDDKNAKKEIDELNKKIYERNDEEINKLYDAGNKWSMDAFELMYDRLGTKFDEYFPESSVSQIGIDIVKENEGVFEKSDGAIIFPGEKHGLHTRVFINSEGLPTYEAKELGLNKKKNELYNLNDSIIVTGNEITAYFKVLLRVMELTIPEVAMKTVHISHGMMRLPDGKMSSRKGTVITAEKFINDIKSVIKEKIKNRESIEKSQLEEISEAVAIGAIKYSILKQGTGRDIIFDPETALSFEGDSGPYLQYTYARMAKIISKSQTPIDANCDTSLLTEESELSIIKHLIEYPDTVARTCESKQPNHIALYIYELANLANTFYEKVRVLDDENEKRKISRLMLIKVTTDTLKKGLEILGICVLEQM